MLGHVGTEMVCFTHGISHVRIVDDRVIHLDHPPISVPGPGTPLLIGAARGGEFVGPVVAVVVVVTVVATVVVMEGPCKGLFHHVFVLFPSPLRSGGPDHRPAP